MKIKRKRISKRVLVAIIVAACIVGSVAYIVYAQKADNDTNKKRKSITYSGPSEQDKKDAEDENSSASKREEIENNQSATTSSKKQVNPVITNANQSGDQVTVNAYISGVFEDGGTCTMTATKGTKTITRTSKAFADATTTNCSPLSIDRSAFSESGTWGVVVSYSSNSAEGKSQTSTLAVQ